MSKKIGFIIIALMGLTVLFIPKEAHAAKVRIQPSISFNNTFTQVQPRRVYAMPTPVVHHYTYYDYYGPYEEVYVQEPVTYYVPRPVIIRSPAVNFGLKFRF